MYVSGCCFGFSYSSCTGGIRIVVVAAVITTLLTEVNVVISCRIRCQSRISRCIGNLIYVEVYVRSIATAAGRSNEHNLTSYVINERMLQDFLIDHTLDILLCGIVVSTYDIRNVIKLSFAFVKNDSLILLMKLAELLLGLLIHLTDLIHVANSGTCSSKYLYDAYELSNEQEEKRKPTVGLVKEVFESK